MKLSEAIEILGQVIEDKKYSPGEPGYEALKLGIEAGKRIEYLREPKRCVGFRLLPGETKE